MRVLTTATETETGKHASDFLCLGGDDGRCDATATTVVLENGLFNGAAACADHVEDVRSYMTRDNGTWKRETTGIELDGRVFRREGEDRWRMDSRFEQGVDVTFGADSVWEWRVLAAALDEIERLRS
ncbi:MAG: hypothetical protein RJB65_2568 [Actinomycetota bacterium]|jgi:hypothetical protein